MGLGVKTIEEVVKVEAKARKCAPVKVQKITRKRQAR
jgi:hypothetical protein